MMSTRFLLMLISATLTLSVVGQNTPTRSQAVPDRYPGEKMEHGFITPPGSAKPLVWWHWMNGNATEVGITADLEAMKRVGIHGAIIFNIDQDIPEGQAPFMSPHWLELTHFAAAEADRLGMELGFANCGGWSSSGGPWIKPEFGMQTVVTSEVQAKGGTRFNAILPQPPTKLGYYRDIAVLAFPTPVDGTRIDKLGSKSLSGSDYVYGQQPVTKRIPVGAAVPKDQIIDLTAKLSSDGILEWDVPAGNWTILRLGHTPTGEENHPSPLTGRGLECDKLSREALDAHWTGAIAPVLERLGPLVGKSLSSLLIDSYEVGNDNWTPKFRSEFIKRRGYDPILFLPTITGRYVENGEVTERFLWDFRRTIGDLFNDNYYSYFSELCKSKGLLSAIEPYDGPFESLQVAAKAEIVLGEFWVGGAYASSVKLAASVGHTHGTPIIGAESFTADPDHAKFLAHPASLKALGDMMWCTGLNRFIFHTYAQQPWLDKLPGMTMGRYGTHFSRNNTWWEQSSAWMSYLGRSQFLLQQGRFAADVLFFGGESSPGSGRLELKDRGYDYDMIGTDLIYSLTVKDHLVCTPAGGSYRVLVLPETIWMTPALVKKMGELARAGATIIGPKPQKSPSLAGFPGCDAEVAKVADEVWGSVAGEHKVGEGRVISDRSIDEVISDMKLQPDFTALQPQTGLAYIHRVVGDMDMYFVSNQKTQPQNLECAFRVTGRQPELWDAETGKITTAPLWRVQNGRTIVTLNLVQAGSVFVIFRKFAPAPVDPIVHITRKMVPPSTRTFPKLIITRALYGTFSMTNPGLIDLTVKMALRIQDGQLHASDYNSMDSDPAAGLVKELRVEYEVADQHHYLSVSENQPLNLPVAGETGKVRIIRAVYGKFSENIKELNGLPVLKNVDITRRIVSRTQKNMLDVQVSNELAGTDPTPLVPKELYVEFTVDGVSQSAIARENQYLRIPMEVWNLLPPEPCLMLKNSELRLVSAEAGHVTFTTASGVQKSATIAFIPKPIEIMGPWKVTFPPKLGAPEKATFDQLISWPTHLDAGIKYFSGTAVYHKVITIPAANFGTNRSLELDLGRVEVIAEVRLNGKDLGILWKSPFRVNIDGVAKTGKNELEIRITNLWPNRMIGDEQFVDDCEWNGSTIKRWPDWMVNGTPRPSTNRVTFVPWKDWHKDSPLEPSGLLGPVVIRTYISAAVK